VKERLGKRKTGPIQKVPTDEYINLRSSNAVDEWGMDACPNKHQAGPTKY
jgi:hypothetical protein